MNETAQAMAGLIDWYRRTARPLPWRVNPTPYGVWVSEVMLQQTRVETVIPYYERFMRAYPTVADLAAAEESQLMKLWEGLGYYSRARNLQKAARQMVERHGGQIPPDYEALQKLPGFGPYTAGAVASLAFYIPVPAVDGNVLRVTARLLADFRDVMQPATRRAFTDTVRGWMPPDRAGDFNAALMELGERVCLPNTAPHCEDCPLSAVCAGHRDGVAALLPTRSPKKERRVEERTVLAVLSLSVPRRVLFCRRPSTGLLAGLWELPNGLTAEWSVHDWLAAHGAVVKWQRPLESARHLFSHVEWRMQGVAVAVEQPFEVPGGRWVTLDEQATQLALPSAFRAFAQWLPVLMEQEYE